MATEFGTDLIGTNGEKYDLIARAIPHYDEMQEKAAYNTRIFTYPKRDILEIGVGTGTTLLSVLSQIHHNARIVAIDDNSDMLGIAQKRVEDIRVTFKEVEALRYLKRCESRSLDTIYSAFTIHNLEPSRRRALFREIKRVLKKRGAFINADKYAYESVSMHVATLSTQLNLLAAHLPTEIQDPWIQHYCTDELRKFMPTEQLEYMEGTFMYRWNMEALFFARNV